MELKDLIPITMLLITLAIGLSIGSIVLDEYQDQIQTYNFTSTNSTGNDAHLTGNRTTHWFPLTHTVLQGSTERVWNATNNSENLSRNVDYIMNTSDGAIRINGSFPNQTFNMSYLYRGNLSTAATNISTFGLASVTTIGSWMPTIALVLIAAVIIGLVVAYLANRI
tara:strand:- start:15415 stop:15915 length:501 start_codon:yes stop_codon:yes gene_type:complete